VESKLTSLTSLCPASANGWMTRDEYHRCPTHVYKAEDESRLLVVDSYKPHCSNNGQGATMYDEHKWWIINCLCMVQITGYKRKWKEISQTASVCKTLSSCKHKMTLKCVGRVHKIDTMHTIVCTNAVFPYIHFTVQKDTCWSWYHQRGWRVQCDVRPL